jgi:hypothetical protein
MAPFRDDAEELRRQFAVARDDLAKDLNSTVHHLRNWTNWREVVRKHPWWSLAGAMALGYWAVPQSRECPCSTDKSVGPTAIPKGGATIGSVAQVLAQSAARMLMAYTAERAVEALGATRGARNARHDATQPSVKPSRE